MPNKNKILNFIWKKCIKLETVIIGFRTNLRDTEKIDENNICIHRDTWSKIFHPLSRELVL